MQLDKKEKTAKEMFEKLGYKLTEDECFLKWGKFEPLKYENFLFDKEEKCWYVDMNLHMIKISKETNKAIQKQLKEMGWLDEK